MTNVVVLDNEEYSVEALLFFCVTIQISMDIGL